MTPVADDYKWYGKLEQFELHRYLYEQSITWNSLLKAHLLSPPSGWLVEARRVSSEKMARYCVTMSNRWTRITSMVLVQKPSVGSSHGMWQSTHDHFYSASEIVSSPTRLAYLQAKPLTAKQKERILNGIVQVKRGRRWFQMTAKKALSSLLPISRMWWDKIPERHEAV